MKSVMEGFAEAIGSYGSVCIKKHKKKERKSMS